MNAPPEWAHVLAAFGYFAAGFLACALLVILWALRDMGDD